VLVMERPQQLDLRLEPLELLGGSHGPAVYLHFSPCHLDAFDHVETFVAANQIDHVNQQTQARSFHVIFKKTKISWYSRLNLYDFSKTQPEIQETSYTELLHKLPRRGKGGTLS
jgi:hypothetical protein